MSLDAFKKQMADLEEVRAVEREVTLEQIACAKIAGKSLVDYMKGPLKHLKNPNVKKIKFGQPPKVSPEMKAYLKQFSAAKNKSVKIKFGTMKLRLPK